MGRQPTPTPTCPACGSNDVGALKVAEHKRCGAVKPAEQFRTEDGVVCPKCDRECEGKLVYIQRGELRVCRGCGRRFDADKGTRDSKGTTAVPTGDLWTGVETEGELITFSSRSRSTTRTVLSVLLLTIIVGSAVVAAIGTAPLLEQQTESAHWEEYQTIVMFRNDDVQPYYRTEEMRAVDRVFIEENASVTGGVIPAPGNMTLSSDMEICQYWRQMRSEHPETFEYALHGYHHEASTQFYEGSEFGNVPIERQRALIRNGSRIMEDCLETAPDTFVPPRETYDNTTAEVLSEENFTAVSGGDWFTRAYYNRTNLFRAHGVLHVPSDGGFIKNWSADEFYSERTLEKRFDREYRNGSLYVQMLHYQYFTSQARLDTLRGLIEHMKSKGDVSFMTVGTFAEKYAAGEIERTENGWRVWEPERTRSVSVKTVLDRALDELRQFSPTVSWGEAA